MSHARRPEQSRHVPVHVTLKLEAGVPSLRGRRSFRVVRRALGQLRQGLGFRVVEYSVQGNHIHLIGEATDRCGLSRGMQGLCIRIAKRLNALHGRRGSIFRDRYHARPLKTPVEVRNALLYVLNNYRRHCAERGLGLPADQADECSSALFFEHWQHTPRLRDPCSDLPPGTAPPQSFLLRRGWLRYGALALAAIPKAVTIAAEQLLGTKPPKPPKPP